MKHAACTGETGWPSNKDEKHGETHLSQVSAFSVSSLELQRVNALAFQTSNSRATEQCSTKWVSQASLGHHYYWSIFLNDLELDMDLNKGFLFLGLELV